MSSLQTVVGVSFKKAGKVYYFDPDDLEMRYLDKVIVETSRGVELGEVIVNPKKVEEDEIVQPLKKVIRKATEKDLEQLEVNQEKEKEAYSICLEKISNHGLPMKLVDVEYTFDNNKIIFYFTADGRVDFRELVKDLASVFRTRIELRQIGVRDEAKMIGGLGPCGRQLCCKVFLREFEPISIKMAKNQDLSLNPAKISGICGRLMCCLRYESDVYEDEEDQDADHHVKNADQLNNNDVDQNIDMNENDDYSGGGMECDEDAKLDDHSDTEDKGDENQTGQNQRKKKYFNRKRRSRKKRDNQSDNNQS